MVEFDQSILGKEFVLGSFHVTEDMIKAFARAVGETSPQYVDSETAKQTASEGLIAPPIFYDVFRADQIPDPKVKFGKVGFNAGQRCEFHAPIRPGDAEGRPSHRHLRGGDRGPGSLIRRDCSA